MLDALISPSLPAPGRPTASSGYLLRCEVHELSGQAAHGKEEQLRKQVQRHLNRLERVLVSHGGRLIRALPQGLLARFHSAQAALLGACEMQQRCAAIPQLSNLQLALKIGIHHAAAQYQGSKQTVDPAVAKAARLMALLAGPGIVLSQAVADNLPASLKAISTRLAAGMELDAFTVDWKTLPPFPPSRPNTGGDPAHSHTPATGSRVLLHQDGSSFTFDGRHAVIAIGRDSTADVPVGSPKTSRIHARIVYRLGNYVLVDVSTNGTYLYPEQGAEAHLRKNMATLAGKGRLAFGMPWAANTPHSFEFEVIRGMPAGAS